MKQLEIVVGVALRGHPFLSITTLCFCAGVATEGHNDFNLFYVFPVPRFIKVRTKAEALRVFDEPLIRRSVYLNRAIRILRIDRAAADVEV